MKYYVNGTADGNTRQETDIVEACPSGSDMDISVDTSCKPRERGEGATNPLENVSN